MSEPISVLSRRRLLAGGLAGAGAVALAGCVDKTDDVAADPNDLVVTRVDRVPVDDPGAEAWQHAEPVRVAMDAQAIALPFRPTPSVPEILVRAVHDGSTIAFRLVWDDPVVDDLTVPVDAFRDACAVLLAPGDGDQALRVMGNADTPATLLHWKADWQRDMEDGVQGQAEVYPNMSVDVYPPLVKLTPGDVTPADYEEAGVTQWLPGMHVGNPMSQHTRTTCVEKLIARGFGTSTTAASQNAVGHGDRLTDGWRVVPARPLAATEDEEVALSPGSTYTCAFAVWSGRQNDAGGRKTPSAVAHRLVLEA